ncbi:MAG TPA: hypothetical protein VM925_17215 [Labilithrix sp.]|nr:hypothetical protein [Labilithrix sp.]
MAAETLIEYDAPLVGKDGNVYRARACGRGREDGTWEGWVEFEAIASANELVWRTPRETTQPNRRDVVYWATGLSGVFLEGALARAMEPPPHVAVRVPAPPAFEGPADDVHVDVEDVEAFAAPVTAILDPFLAYAKSEVFLRRQLGALDAWHLRNIARAHRIVTAATPLDDLGKTELIELIVAHVRAFTSAVSPAR